MPYHLVAGVLVEPLGDVWVAYSPASGETAMLNNECAAMLEVLREAPRDSASVGATLCEDCGVPAEQLLPMLEAHWQLLVGGGFVRRCESDADRCPSA
jgi:PqqD family protein of HPr-rel-A system